MLFGFFSFRQGLFVDLIKAYINMENQLGHKKNQKKMAEICTSFK